MRTKVYVLQDQWLKQGWRDNWCFKTENEAIAKLTEIINDPVWRGDNNERDWRVIRRTITETVRAS